MTVKFGTAGNPESFYAKGYKRSSQMPIFLSECGLDAYEYQCGRGVMLKADTANEIKTEAEKHNITVSLHSPYFISLSTTEESKIANNIRYITESATAVKLLGGNRVVVHSGSCGKVSREQALAASKANLVKAQAALDEMGLSDVILCPETMGKINQIGTLEEVIELCLLDERFIPCIDFGHLNARTLGGIKTAEDYENILNEVENKLGFDRASRFHSHFSKIEYSAGGEVKHLTFDDKVYGPDFEPLAEVILKKNYSPTIISESAGTQSEDAMIMKRILTDKAGK